MTRIAAAALAAIIFAGAAPPKQRTPVDAAWEELAAQLHAMQVRRTLDERDIYSTEPGPLFVPYDFHLMRTGKRQERLPVGDPMRELLR